MKKLSLVLALFLSTSAFAAVDFETLERDAAFERFVPGFDLDSAAYTLKYKDSGTSVGIKVESNGDKVGKWAPTNSATNPEAQVVSYTLARFLRMSELVVPSAYYVAGPRAISTFKAMLDGAKEKNAQRIANRALSLSAIAKNPNALLGVFTAPVKNFEVAELVNAGANTINRNYSLAGFIRADGPVPSKTKRMALKGLRTKDGKSPTETEYELARELSQIMVLDILTGQWDRWSGGNMEATFDKSGQRAILLSRDNGGATMNGTSQLNKYFGIVSRFDRAQIQKIKDLQQELARDPAGVAKALQMRSSPKSLQLRVNALLNQVENIVKAQGEARTFF